MIYENAKKGFDLIIKNYKVLVPDILFILIALVISLIFAFASGIIPIIFSQNFEEALRYFIENTSNLIRLIISLAMAIILTFLVGISVTSTKYEFIKNILYNKKITLKKAFINSKKYFMKVFAIRISVFLLYLIPILITALIINLFKNTIITFILLIILSLYLVILTISLIYRYPVLFLRNKNVYETLSASYKYFRKNIKYTLFILLTVFLVAFLIGFAISLIRFTIPSIQNASLLTAVSIFVYTIIRLFINVIISVWISIFIFISYKSKS